MKKRNTLRKLTLNAETIAQLRQLPPGDLDRARGGMIDVSRALSDCTKTKTEANC